MFQPSEIYYKRDALYNFLEEGFLSSDIVQAAGSSKFKANDGTVDQIRLKCIKRAEDIAIDRLVSMMLHTKLGIGSKSADTAGNFAADYPHNFTDREILLASIDFAPLLNQSFIAFQEFSDSGRCTTVIRIIEPNIVNSILAVRLSFDLAY